MITFYDIRDGKAIPYHGEAPYVHWAGPFSTGLYRYKMFVFHADPEDLVDADGNPRPVSVEIESQAQPVFSIYKAPGGPVEELDGQEWHSHTKGLEELCLFDSVVLEENDGWCQMLLVCKSDTEGEFVVGVSIMGKIYKFGAEFEAENELLAANLVNRGTELPDAICKALADTDIYEENTDWVVLNNKYRELLSNYLDVIGNKGSYKSLRNALSWFGYQDLVTIREVWKYETPAGTKYFDDVVQESLTTEIGQRWFNCAKTTYFILKQIAPATTYGHHPLDTEDAKTVATRWSETEMRLKMTLLGHFFERYFMPIHTSILKSCVEDVCEHVGPVLMAAARDSEYNECYDATNNFNLTWSSEQMTRSKAGYLPDGRLDPGSGGQRSSLFLYLDEVHTLSGAPWESPVEHAFENNTPQISTESYADLPYIPIIACHQYDDDMLDYDSEDGFLAAMSYQVFNGIGATADATFTFPEKIVSGRLVTDIHGTPIETTMELDKRHATNTFTVKFLFQNPGDFYMNFMFYDEHGVSYTKTVAVHVEDNIRPDLVFRYMRYAYGPDEKLPNPFEAKPTPSPEPEPAAEAGNYIWSRTKYNDSEIIPYQIGEADDVFYGQTLTADSVPTYSQYIPISIDGNPTHPDAPMKTPLYTIRVEGEGCYDRLVAFVEEKLGGCWYRIGTQRDIEDTAARKWAWVQYIYKTSVPPTEDVDISSLTKFNPSQYVKHTFFPQFHELAVPGPEVPLCYPIVVVPVIKIYTEEVVEVGIEDQTEAPKYRQIVKNVPYSHHVGAKDGLVHMWEFYSWSRHRNIKALEKDISEPFMASALAEPMPVGYYTVTFNYNFGAGRKSIKKHTPFRLVEA